MPIIETLGMQAAQAGLGAAMGLALEGHNDRRQLRQQQKLQNLQIQGQQQLTDYNFKKQLEMWEKTNYGAQVEQLKKAGLNPGLLYGMGGAGGATTGIQAGNVTGADAPKGGQEAMGMGLQLASQQLQLIKAQKENIEADTENKQADTANKPLTGKNIEATTANLNVQNRILQAEETIKDVEAHIAGELQNVNVAKAKTELRTATAEMHQAENEKDISDETKKDRIQLATQTVAEVKARIELAKANKNKSEAEIENMAKDIALKARQIATLESQQEINKQLAEFETSFGGQAAGILGNVLSLFGLKGKK